MRSLIFLLIFLFISAMSIGQDTVHVVFKTHLDIGFTDFPHKVVEKYFREYIPGSIHTAGYMAKYGNGDGFIWTTGAWLIDKFLREASVSEVKMMEEAIRKGYISWHGYPFSGYNMLMNKTMFEESLAIAGDLDKQFGKRTISAKLTDLPGETRSVIKMLAEHGIRVLHIGTNPGHNPPNVPPVFVWRNPEGQELIVILQGTYGESLVIPGFHNILHFAFTNDNLGPQTPEMVRLIFTELRKKYPGAVIKASTLDDYSARLISFKDKLPVITSEIGSTWIHGVASDPMKLAGYRALQRLLEKWIADGKVKADDPLIKDFSRHLLMITEHTWGLDEKMHLDFMHWSPDELDRVRQQDNYRDMEKSWKESRDYISKAVNLLTDSGLASEAKKELDRLIPAATQLVSFKRLDLSGPVETKFFTVKIDGNSGAIISLIDKNKRSWASPSEPLGLFWHESFSYDDYERFRKQYNKTDALWVLFDFGKPMMAGDLKSKQIPVVKESFIKQDDKQTTIVLRLAFPEKSIHSDNEAAAGRSADYGLPEAEVKINFPVSDKTIEYQVQWFKKRANRLPEAFWFTFNPSGCDPDGWSVEVIDQFISPSDVVSFGGKSLQAFNRGVFYEKKNEKLVIQSLDCGIVAPGTPSLLDFNDKIPDLSKGWNFNLYNNKWGTNFPTWYDDDALFRFVLYFNDQTLTSR